MKDTKALRQSIIDTCLWLKNIGYILGTWGNVSVRLDDDNILITPSRLDYDIMKPEDLVVINLKGEIVSGERLPTSERDIHRSVYAKRQDIQAIIHTHSVYAMAVAATGEGVPAISEEMCQVLGGGIPISYEFVPSDMHSTLGDVVGKSLTDSNAILIRNHGIMCFGETLEDAKICCQIAEKNCKIYLSIKNTPKVEIISRENVLRGRDYYKNSYGKS